MKLMRIALSLTLLFMGCYTNTAVTKDTLEVDDVKVDDATLIFRLKDGSYITSKGGQHQRTGNGYSVVGSLAVKGIPGLTDFAGIVRDDQIKEVTTSTFSVGLTVLVVGSAVVLVLVSVGGAAAGQWHWGKNK